MAHQQAAIPDVKLWSPETPNLYVLVTRIEASGRLSDLYRTTFGVRTVEFSPSKGFSLNGRHRFIKGVCNHHDFAGVGAAVPDRLQEYRVAMLRQMGCDGWRTSHNPVNEELLDECDRQGMMVMDETRRFGKYSQPLSDLTAMILRDRNHPSIVIWSLGNEEMGVQGSASGAEACKVMQNLAHQLDPSRLCTVAINHQFDNEGFTTVLDVTGMNYLKLWGSMNRLHEKHPARRFITSEEASTLTTRGLYFEDKPKGYLTAYDTFVPGWGSTAEGWWNHYQSRPWVAGGFVWTGYDYRGEPTPYGWPCISSHFGIMDTCGFPKDNYYYYKAWWTGEPVLHLYPHWNWNRVGHRLIKVVLKTPLPDATVVYGGVHYAPNGGHKKPLEWSIYDDGDYKDLTIVARRAVQGRSGSRGKAKNKGTEVVKQSVPITRSPTTTAIVPLPGQGPLPPDENLVTVSAEEAPIRVWAQTNFAEAELFVNGGVPAGEGRAAAPRGMERTLCAGQDFGHRLSRWESRQDGNDRNHRSCRGPQTHGQSQHFGWRRRRRGPAQSGGPRRPGRTVPTAGNRVHFDVAGSGRLLGVGNGDPSCHESDLGPDRSLFNGLALGIVQASSHAGELTVKVSAEGLRNASLTLAVRPAPLRPAVP